MTICVSILALIDPAFAPGETQVWYFKPSNAIYLLMGIGAVPPSLLPTNKRMLQESHVLLGSSPLML